MADVVFAMKRYGFNIRIVSRAEFDRIMQAAAKDEAESETVMSLLAYETGSDEKLAAVSSNNRFTTNALYRLNYKWPIIDDAYLEKLIAGIDELSFFDML